MKDRLKSLLLSPEVLFLSFSIFFGLILMGVIPPLGGGDEGFHYHRIASIAYLQMLNQPVDVPSGIIQFLQSGRDMFYSGMNPPFGYSADRWQQMAAIALDASHTQTLQPNFMTVHNPFAYLPQVIVFRLGTIAGLSPLVLLYLARMAGLLTGIALTYHAIRIIPSHKYALAALALLPVITVTRSTLDADIIVDGLAFLFIALVWRESARNGKIALHNILLLAGAGFIMGQCKSPYLLLLLLVFAIPAQRFSSPAKRAAALAFIILPATAASIAWMMLIKATSFSGVGYHTWGGDAFPDMQVAFILHHPLDYTAILIKNMFATNVIPIAVFGIFCDVGPGYTLSFLITFILLYGLIASAISGKNADTVSYNNTLRFLCAVVFLAVIPVILTLVYIHWNGVHAQTILGFQGRYLYPVLPLLFPFARASSNRLVSWPAYKYTMLVAGVGLGSAVLTVCFSYY